METNTSVLMSTASNCCFLIDLVNTSWCLDFTCTYSQQCSAPNRGTRREAVFDKVAVHRSRRDEENMLIVAVTAYAFGDPVRNKQGERNKTLILAACALGHVGNTEERCRKRSEIYLGTRLENCQCYTHKHTFITHIYHSWQIQSTTHQKDTRTSLSTSKIIIIIAFKGAIRDFLQSPHSAANCLQHARSSGPGAIVCKSRATHRALIACNMSCYVPLGTKGQLSY